MSADEITLRLPRERPFFGVAHLVVGGLAARLDLSFEQLEDLQVAIGELLEQHETEREITVSVRVENETIHALVGPFDGSLEQALARGARATPSVSGGSWRPSSTTSRSRPATGSRGSC